MNVARGGATSSRCRRERRSRSWWRDERASVRIAMTAAAHHSYGALRTFSAGGVLPGHLLAVSLLAFGSSQLSLVRACGVDLSVACFASLGTPMLAGHRLLCGDAEIRSAMFCDLVRALDAFGLLRFMVYCT